MAALTPREAHNHFIHDLRRIAHAAINGVVRFIVTGIVIRGGPDDTTTNTQSLKYDDENDYNPENRLH
jgi:hypothetical protein